jgi:diguanylate cyclase (GGDEF)-like protein
MSVRATRPRWARLLSLVWLDALLSLALAGALLLPRFPRGATFAWLALAAGAALAAVLRRESEPNGRERRDLRLLLLGAGLVHAAGVALPGAASAPGGAYAPLIVAAAALLPGYGRALGLAALAAALELGNLALAAGPAPAAGAWIAAAAGAALLALLGLVSAALFARCGRERDALRTELDEHKRLRGEAREIGPQTHRWGGLEARDLTPIERETRVLSAVVDLDGDLDRVLGLARLSVGARTVALWLLDADREQLLLRRAVEGEGTTLDRGGVCRVGEGVVGHAAKTRRPALFTDLDPGSLRPPLYADGTKVAALVIVPVSEEGVFRGVLLADAAAPGAFGREHERLLAGFAGEVTALLEGVRSDASRVRRGDQLETLRLITEAFSSSIKIDAMLARVLDLTREIIPYDRCAFYVADPGGATMTLRAQRGFLPDDSDVVRVPLDHGLPGYLATHRRELLFNDLKERHRSAEIVPNAPGQERIRSFLGVPLREQRRLVGVWVLVADAPGRFDAEDLGLLRVVASQAATIIANAVLHQTVERLAVTDGLTGLYNHRWFQERLAGELERLKRSGEPLSLLLLDIDHFKKINDGHGHPFGDTVLKALAAELGRLARRVDCVARYGGEEFAIILVDTDRRGCRAGAERVLKAVRALRVGDQGFRFTLSIGCATCPDDAATREELIRRADEALYAAKERGRDRAVACDEIGVRA